MKKLLSALLLATAPTVMMAQEVIGITGPAIEPVSVEQLLPRRAPSAAPASVSPRTSVDIQVQYLQSDARAMLQLINDFRTDPDAAWIWNQDNTTKTYLTGLQPLVIDQNLEEIAMQRAAEIVINYNHVRPDGSSIWDFWDDYPFDTRWYGENIAVGYGNTQSAFDAWREENKNYSGQGHRRNMLNSRCNAIGIGCCSYNGRRAWTHALAQISNGLTNAEGTTPCDEIVWVTTFLTNDDVETFISIEPVNSLLERTTGDNWTVKAAVGQEIDATMIATVRTKNQWYYFGNLALMVSPNWSSTSGNGTTYTRYGGVIVPTNLDQPISLLSKLFATKDITLTIESLPVVLPFSLAIEGHPQVNDIIRFIQLVTQGQQPDYNGDGDSNESDIIDLVNAILEMKH